MKKRCASCLEKSFNILLPNTAKTLKNALMKIPFACEIQLPQNGFFIGQF